VPLLDYKCTNCNKEFETLLLKSDEKPPTRCIRCGSEAIERVIKGTDFQLKGDGWAKDNYGGRSKRRK
jgi:putative FmdB family regulatory protein